MHKRYQTILSITFPLYLAIVLFTKFSFTGYWTDIIIAILLTVLSIKFGISKQPEQPSVKVKRINAICSLIVLGLLTINIFNPFAWSAFRSRSFYFQSVDGRLFNAYFKPVGSFSGGYGNFWITETPKYFPLIEWEVYYKHAFDYDLNDDTFEGRPVDNNEVVRNCIGRYVIGKKQYP